MVQEGPQDARLAMMRLYAELKGSEDENPVSRARAAEDSGADPTAPLYKGVKRWGLLKRGEGMDEVKFRINKK